MENATLYDPTIGSNLLTTAQAAEYLKFNIFSIRRLASQKALKSYNNAGKKALLFRREDLDRYRLQNAWARKKAGIEKPTEQPAPPPPATLEAEIHVDLGFGIGFMHHFGTRKDFSWEQIPLIKAEIDNKHGGRPFTIGVESPDGGSWLIEYNPPPLLQRLFKKLTGK